MYDLKVFREYLHPCDEIGEIEDTTPVELQKTIKKNCFCHVKENERSFLAEFIQSIARPLRKVSYGFYIRTRNCAKCTIRCAHS